MSHPEAPNGGATTVLAQALGEVKQQLSSIASEQSSQRDLLTRFDERQKGWATKQEVSEVASTLRQALAPVASQAAAAHARLDGFDIDLSEFRKQNIRDVESSTRRLGSLTLEVGPLVGADGEVANIKAKLDHLKENVDSLRLSWARATGMAMAAGFFGSVATAVLPKLLN